MPKVLCVAYVDGGHDFVCDDEKVYPFPFGSPSATLTRIKDFELNGKGYYEGMSWESYVLQEFDHELRGSAENIYDYYVERLSDTPDDESLRELPIDSGCGEPCKDAIDYASGLLRHLKDAHGNNKPHLEQQLLNVVNDIVVCYWRG
jgi:hypothetical protein